jgi:Cu/Zn superoxide dismutase
MFEARLVAVVLAAAGLIGVAGCGGGSDDETAGAADLTLQLVEQNSSGQDGTATFTSLAGGRTRIVLELTNPPEVPQPAHVHSGTCDDLGDPVVALTSVEDGTSDTEVERSLEELEQGDLVVHAHKSEAEYDVSVACAPIGRG